MRTKQRGVALLAIVSVVLIIVVAALAKSALQAMNSRLAHQINAPATLTNLDRALANFVAQNRRLPCPADGTIAAGAATAGVEQRDANTGACIPTTQLNGVAPWVTLGLSEEQTLDSWGNRITYRVEPSLTAEFAAPYHAMDMSNCTTTLAVSPIVNAPPITTQCSSVACTGSACTYSGDVLVNKGLDVWDGVVAYAARSNSRGTTLGAAYVLISHGANAAGAYSTAGTLQAGAGTIGSNETLNRNSQVLTLPQTQATSFRDALFDNTSTATHFDDQLSHPTILTVLQNAHLAPRQP